MVNDLQTLRDFKRVQKGTTGTKIYSGYFDEEYLQKIKHMRGMDLYDEMRRSDSQIAMLLSVVKNPIKSARWSVESVDDTDQEKEIRDFVYHCLFKDIGNPVNGKRKNFKEFLEEALTFIEFGFSVFEIVHKNVKGHKQFGDYIGLQDLAYRSQKTIETWKIRPDGSIESIRQLVNGDLKVDVQIPGEYLLTFSIQKEGDNYEGISLLRPCYGNWFRKNNYLKALAIGVEKTSIGVPVGKMSKEFMDRDDYDEQFATLQDILEQFAAHENQALVIPAGVEFDEVKISFDAEKVQMVIDAEDVKMSKRFLANFMELGLSGSGSYSLGSDLSDIFLSGIEYIADMICDKLNQCVIETLVKAKYGEREYYPRLVHRGINDKAGKELADIIGAFVDRGVIKPSDRLEDYIHDRYDLPDVKRDQERDNEIEPPELPDDEQEPFDDGRSPDDHVLDEYPVSISFLSEKVLAEISTIPPKKAQSNAKRGLELREKWGRGGTAVGVARARDISNAKSLSRSTIARMAAFERHRKNYRPEIKEDDGGATAGTIAWLLWGGNEGIDWAKSTLDQLDTKLDEMILRDPKISNMRPSVYIDRKAKDLENQMRERLIERSDDMLDTVAKILNGKGTNTEKQAAVLKTTMPYSRDYAAFLRSYVGEAGQETIKATLQELDKTEYKFSEKDFDGLPRKARERIKKELALVAKYQDADLEKMIYFSVLDQLDKKTPVATIIQEIKKQRTRYFGGGLIFVAATNLLSKVVNGVRNDVYQEPDIMDDIESFIFVNHDPKSAICQNLTGRVFSKEEYESSPYLPPLHHNCYHKDTEVYTDKGFIKFSELSGDELFLSLNSKTLDLDLVKAIEHQKIKHSGDLYHFTNNQGSLSQCVTEDHPMIYMKRVDRGNNGRTKEWVESDITSFIKAGSEASVYCSSNWSGEHPSQIIIGNKKYNPEFFAKFMGYWLSEGHLTDYNRIIITQHNQDNKDMIEDDLSKYCEIQSWKTQTCIKDENLYQYLKQFGKSFEKFVPKEILSLDKALIRLFLNAYCLGDGTEYKNRPCFNGVTNYRAFFTSSKQMADNLAECIIKTGKSVSQKVVSQKGKISKHKNGEYAKNHDVYGVFELSSQTRRASVIERIHYDDYVYDVTLEKNHTLLIKLNGCISWGSNCKSIIQAQTKGKKGNKPIDSKGLTPSGTNEELDKIFKSKTI